MKRKRSVGSEKAWWGDLDSQYLDRSCLLDPNDREPRYHTGARAEMPYITYPDFDPVSVALLDAITRWWGAREQLEAFLQS